MNHELESKLAKNFPFMIARNLWSGEICLDENKNPYGFPCECDDGWYNIIHDCCTEIKEIYEQNKLDMNNIFTYQIKEKFGRLDINITCVELAYDAITKYENLSKTTCEICGEKGEIKCLNGWLLKALCERCHENIEFFGHG